MTHIPVFSEWTSTLSWPKPEPESPKEEDVKTEWESNKESPEKKPCNSSNKDMKD